jgi:hypothetical protein
MAGGVAAAGWSSIEEGRCRGNSHHEARTAPGWSDKCVGRRETTHLWVVVHWAGKMHAVYVYSVGECFGHEKTV